MDYTPISARRVVVGFSLTAFVALAPLLFLFLSSSPSPVGAATDGVDGYRGLVLGAGSLVLVMLLIALVTLAIITARRVVRRPSRA